MRILGDLIFAWIKSFLDWRMKKFHSPIVTLIRIRSTYPWIWVLSFPLTTLSIYCFTKNLVI